MSAAQEVENLQEKLNWHWRNSMRVVRFFAFDARAAIPIPLLLVYARLSTLILTIITMIVFHILEQKGLTFPSAIRSLRSGLVGDNRPGWLSAHRKKFVDYG
ncbi:MAG: IcmT/TraK family protein [Alphaproteobacteria bacterium]|nr:IcmT/TraK family protein [Alphaproteobacteria bacterium]